MRMSQVEGRFLSWSLGFVAGEMRGLSTPSSCLWTREWIIRYAVYRTMCKCSFNVRSLRGGWTVHSFRSAFRRCGSYARYRITNPVWWFWTSSVVMQTRGNYLQRSKNFSLTPFTFPVTQRTWFIPTILLYTEAQTWMEYSLGNI